MPTDPLSDLTLSLRGFRALARRLHRLAHRHCQGRWVATGGGGYDLDRVVPRAWALLWSELSGRRLPARVPSAWLAARPERQGGQPSGWLEPRRRRREPPGPGSGSWRSATSGRSGRCGGWCCRRRCGWSTRWPGGPAGPGGCRGGSRGRASTTPRGGPLVLRDRCPASLLRRLEVDPGIHAFVRDPDQEREVLARIAEEPTGEVVVAHTPEGVVVGYVAVLDPEPGTRFASLPGPARGRRGRGGQPAGGGAGWPAPCSASPSSPTRSRTSS